MTETALPIALGIRAERADPRARGGRARAADQGRDRAGDGRAGRGRAAAGGRHGGGRRAAAERPARGSGARSGALPFYRAFVAIEFTLLALAAAIVDAVAGDLIGSRVLVIALVPLAAITALGHLVAILTSDRLR